MPTNKKQMLFGLTKKAQNKLKKTALEAALMETKTLPRAKEDHSKNKNNEERNQQLYELSVQRSSQSKTYVATITKKVNVENPRKIYMAELAVKNQFKLDEAKVECIGSYCKKGVSYAKNIIDFPSEDDDVVDITLSWWHKVTQKWGT